MATFQERLKELRRSMGWSQDTLADKLGTTRSCIGNYEQGTRKPDIEALEQIADLFNVDMSYLVGKQKEKRLSDNVSQSVLFYLSKDRILEILNTKGLTIEDLASKLDAPKNKDERIEYVNSIINGFIGIYESEAEHIARILGVPLSDIFWGASEATPLEELDMQVVFVKQTLRKLNVDRLTEIINYAEGVLDVKKNYPHFEHEVVPDNNYEDINPADYFDYQDPKPKDFN